ncbi:MAG: hypothetical protein AAF985_05490, partial [Bacteroidota bacterium]
MSDEKKPKKIFSQWLEKLQQESWQLELLISGFALFGIWESREGVSMFKEYLDVHDPFKSEAIRALDLMGVLFQSIWAIFFINLLIHVILRGLWIGAIGLRYVSDEIDYESFNYSDYFRDYLEDQVGSFDHYIERLEKICSVIFAYTFLLFFIFFSFVIFVIEATFLARLVDELLVEKGYHVIAIFTIMLFLFGGLIVFIDFITQGSLKKIKNHRISKGYGYLYR